MRLRYRYVSYGVGPGMIDHMHQLMHQMILRATPNADGAWQPPTDVYESEDQVVVQVELAGVKEEAIEITLYADHLAISGTREKSAPPGTAAYYLAGILYGEFRVEVPVLASVLRDEVEASYENGLLTVVLPKAAVHAEPTNVRIGQSVPAEPAEVLSQGEHHGH